MITHGHVVMVDLIKQKVKVELTTGTTPWISINKSKASLNASEYDMPNIGDSAIVGYINDVIENPVVLGFMEHEKPERTIIADADNKPTGSVADIKDKLIHRYYWKHESGTYTLLDKLGKFIFSLFKKASAETDTAKPNVNVEIDNLGVLTLTHYRGSDKKSTEVSADQSGNLNVTLYKDDGSTTAYKMSADKNGNVTIEGAGNVTVKATGNVITDGVLTELNKESNPLAGCVTGQSICPFIGVNHVDFSTCVLVKK